MSASISTVRQDERGKLTVTSEGSGNLYLYPPVHVLLREEQADATMFIVRADSTRVLLVADEQSVEVLSTFRFVEDDAAVQSALKKFFGGVEAAEIRAAQQRAAEEPGHLTCDGFVFTVNRADIAKHFLLGRDALPTLDHIEDSDDGTSLIAMRYPDRQRVFLRVAAEFAAPSLKAAVFLSESNETSSGQSGTGPVRQRWEYMVVKNMLASTLESTLNSLGSEGWEVVALAGLDGVFSLTGNKLYAVLKRARLGDIGPIVRGDV